MTKTYELTNGKMIMADVNEKHHTAKVSVYALDDLIEAVNKTGHWIDTDEGFSPCKCSECETVEFKKSDYCPNCGARMIEERSEQ